MYYFESVPHRQKHVKMKFEHWRFQRFFSGTVSMLTNRNLCQNGHVWDMKYIEVHSGAQWGKIYPCKYCSYEAIIYDARKQIQKGGIKAEDDRIYFFPTKMNFTFISVLLPVMQTYHFIWFNTNLCFSVWRIPINCWKLILGSLRHLLLQHIIRYFSFSIILVYRFRFLLSTVKKPCRPMHMTSSSAIPDFPSNFLQRSFINQTP